VEYGEVARYERQRAIAKSPGRMNRRTTPSGASSPRRVVDVTPTPPPRPRWENAQRPAQPRHVARPAALAVAAYVSEREKARALRRAATNRVYIRREAVQRRNPASSLPACPRRVRPIPLLSERRRRYSEKETEISAVATFAAAPRRRTRVSTAL